jgi:phospholipase/carboxylesterase
VSVDLNPGRRPDADPHAANEPLRHGPAPSEAEVGMVLIHGRGDSARGILSLAEELESRDAPPVAVLAPEAAGNTWYPYPFLVPTGRNEPWLTSALAAIGRSVDELRAAGLPSERIVIAGFSQGACLASEWVARTGGRWGALVALSGGLIGEEVDPARYPNRLAGTVAFLGCSDVDAHIPESRVRASARQLEAQGAEVETRIYPGMAHTVNADEMSWFVDRVRALAEGAAADRATEG